MIYIFISILILLLSGLLAEAIKYKNKKDVFMYSVLYWAVVCITGFLLGVR